MDRPQARDQVAYLGRGRDECTSDATVRDISCRQSDLNMLEPSTGRHQNADVAKPCRAQLFRLAVPDEPTGVDDLSDGPA